MYGDVSYGDETYGDETYRDETYGTYRLCTKKGFKHKTSLLTPFIGQHPPPSLMATSVGNQSCLCHYALWLQEMVAAIEQTCAHCTGICSNYYVRER
jgi:hypothetical protein